MDSANSGSLQSSSGGAGGGDEDYDSRTETMSSFLNHNSTHFNQNPNPIIPPLSSSSSHHHQTLNTTFFDPSSTLYFPPSNPTNLNSVFDPLWSRNVRPDPTFTGFNATQKEDLYLNSQPDTSLPVTSNANRGRGSDHQMGVANKNPKKRTRASRRAPTTVLTTDTANFRQMVQEFTGIPTAPFSSASASPYSRRLDLFAGGIGPLYPIRPSPQKVQLQQSSSTSVDASSSNYRISPSEIQGFPKQPQTFLNSQNPLFSFQSLIQTKLPQQVNAPILGTTTEAINQQPDLQSGFQSSSIRWRGQNEILASFDGDSSNTPEVDGYKLNSLDFDHETEKGVENVISSRNGVDQEQGNVEAWLCPSD